MQAASGRLFARPFARAPRAGGRPPWISPVPMASPLSLSITQIKSGVDANGAPLGILNSPDTRKATFEFLTARRHGHPH